MSGIQRKPGKDWWDDTKRVLDINDPLELVEGVAVNQFQIQDDSLIIITLKTDNIPPDQQDVFIRRSQEALGEFFAPAKVRVMVIDSEMQIDFTVFNPVPDTPTEALAAAEAKTARMLAEFEAKTQQIYADPYTVAADPNSVPVPAVVINPHRDVMCAGCGCNPPVHAQRCPFGG